MFDDFQNALHILYQVLFRRGCIS